MSGQDALSHNWPNALLYSLPPLPLILPLSQRVLQGAIGFSWWPPSAAAKALLFVDVVKVWHNSAGGDPPPPP